jgi:hypothetical protein
MHYIAAADMIREGTEGQDRELVAEYFSQFFANDNYRFDRSRVHREVTKTKRTAYGV